MSTIEDCRVIDLPQISSESGSLTPVYRREHVPFDIARVYYLYDVPGGAARGGHAHRELQQLIEIHNQRCGYDGLDRFAVNDAADDLGPIASGDVQRVLDDETVIREYLGQVYNV